MRKLFGIVISMFLVVSCSGVSQEEYNDALVTIAELEANEKSLTEEIDQFNASIPELQVLIEEKVALFAELQEQYDELLSENAGQRRELSWLTSDIEKLMCEEELEGMTYNDILTVSSNLMAWVTYQSWAERSNMTVRDTIWNNTDTKLHGVYYTASDDGERYLTWFLVYFDEFGWSDGVFWLDGQCWLEFD